MIPNARFWEYVNGDWVKITLKFGQTLCWQKFQYVDEGWDAWQCTWEHMGNEVSYRSVHSGLDCDGRHDRYWDGECDLLELKVRELPAPFYGDDRSEFEKSLRLPFWQESHCSQRDHFAEAMGY